MLILVKKSQKTKFFLKTPRTNNDPDNSDEDEDVVIAEVCTNLRSCKQSFCFTNLAMKVNKNSFIVFHSCL